MKRDDPNRDLLDLLALWWRYERQQLPVQGYPSECPTTAGYQVSRQYDDGNGAAETDARGMIAKRVGRAVENMAEPYRSALCIAARNRVTGASVWISPRLPVDRDAREAILATALRLFGELV